MASANRVEMDQNVAQKLFIEGAVLVLLDMPLGSEFGIDCNSWNIGEKFRGIKMIPPGVHFIYYSAVGTDGQVAPRTGFFYDFHLRQVLVKKWDPQLEDINQASVTIDEQEAAEKNKMEMDRYLGVYPYDSFSKWVSLSSHISADVVTSLQPLCSHICAAPQLMSCPSTTTSRWTTTAPTDTAGLPVMEHLEGTQIRFSDVIQRHFPDDATAADVTKHSLDASYSLTRLVAPLASETELLGELQFAFICFLIGNVYDAFEQWKRLVRLLCSCDAALTDHSALYLALIPVLHHQLREVPQDFFVDVVSEDNFLVATLRSLFARITEADVPAALQRRASMFQGNLEKRFKWDFSSTPEDEDDCQPVVVETTDGA